MLHNP